MNVKSIVEEWLKEHKFNGLCNIDVPFRRMLSDLTSSVLRAANNAVRGAAEPRRIHAVLGSELNNERRNI